MLLWPSIAQWIFLLNEAELSLNLFPRDGEILLELNEFPEFSEGHFVKNGRFSLSIASGFLQMPML